MKNGVNEVLFRIPKQSIWFYNYYN